MKQILVVALGILSLFANAQTLTTWKKVEIHELHPINKSFHKTYDTVQNTLTNRFSF